MKIKIDWELNENSSYLKSSSLHVPINVEAKKEYDEWVESDCNVLWWYAKEKMKED